MEQVGNSNLRYMKAKEEVRVNFFIINIIMTEEIIKISIDQIEDIEEFSLVDKIEVDQGINRIIEMIIGEEISEIM